MFAMECTNGIKKRRRLPRISPRQTDIMISYMEANDELRDGKLTATFTKSDRRKKWKELAEILNAEGPALKSTDQWRKAWNDQKNHARHKVAKIRLNQYGGCDAEMDSLTQVEERILNITGWMSTLGDPLVEETGLPIVSKVYKAETFEDNTSMSSQPPVFKRKNQDEEKEEKKELLEPTDIVINHLNSQNQLLQRIAIATEQIANACASSASSIKEGLNQISSQTEILANLQNEMKRQTLLIAKVDGTLKTLLE